MVLPAELWYVAHWPLISSKLTFFGDPNNYPIKLYGLPTLFETRNWTYFLLASIQVQGIGLVPMALFALSIFARHARSLRFGLYLLGSVVCNFFVQTVWLDKIPKYVEYSYPIILILTLSWITSQKSKTWIFLPLITLSMIGNLILSLRFLPLEHRWGKLTKEIYLLPGVRFEYDYAPWPIPQLVADIPTRHPPYRILVLTDTETVNGLTLRYYGWRQAKYMDITAPFDLYDPASPRNVTEHDLVPFDIVITRDKGDFGVFVNYETTRAVNALLRESGMFFLAHEYTSPDNNRILMYMRAQR